MGPSDNVLPYMGGQKLNFRILSFSLQIQKDLEKLTLESRFLF
jgi:hypothetical protein